MDWIEAVKDIKQANDNNRLVIFVGSGVSANSGVPTWGKLIDKMAIHLYPELDQDKLAEKKSDYLKIAEYYYDKDEKAYYDLLRKELGTIIK